MESIQLRKLSEPALKAKAKKGDPLAALALAHQFSAEAASLASMPVLANSATEDAIRWYNVSAKMGAFRPRSTSGVGMRPLRATRTRQR